jgi:hypothetical protein
MDTCFICGERNEVGARDAVFAFPNQPAVRCSIIEQAGLNGQIPIGQCPLLPQVLHDTCKCQKIASTRRPSSLPATSIPTPNSVVPIPLKTLSPSPKLTIQPVIKQTQAPRTKLPSTTPTKSQISTPTPTLDVRPVDEDDCTCYGEPNIQERILQRRISQTIHQYDIDIDRKLSHDDDDNCKCQKICDDDGIHTYIDNNIEEEYESSSDEYDQIESSDDNNCLDDYICADDYSSRDDDSENTDEYLNGFKHAYGDSVDEKGKKRNGNRKQGKRNRQEHSEKKKLGGKKSNGDTGKKGTLSKDTSKNRKSKMENNYGGKGGKKHRSIDSELKRNRRHRRRHNKNISSRRHNQKSSHRNRGRGDSIGKRIHSDKKARFHSSYRKLALKERHLQCQVVCSCSSDTPAPLASPSMLSESPVVQPYTTPVAEPTGQDPIASPLVSSHSPIVEPATTPVAEPVVSPIISLESPSAHSIPFPVAESTGQDPIASPHMAPVPVSPSATPSREYDCLSTCVCRRGNKLRVTFSNPSPNVDDWIGIVSLSLQSEHAY